MRNTIALTLALTLAPLACDDDAKKADTKDDAKKADTKDDEKAEPAKAEPAKAEVQADAKADEKAG